METETSLVWSNGAIELDTITEVGLNLAFVIYPSNAECEDTIRLNHSLYDFSLLKLWVLVINLLNRLEYLANCLKILFLMAILLLEVGHYCFNFHNV